MSKIGVTSASFSIIIIFAAMYYANENILNGILEMLKSFEFTDSNGSSRNVIDLKDEFDRNGFVENVTILQKTEMEIFRNSFDKYERAHPDGNGRFRSNSNVYENSQHLNHTWLLDLATHPNVIKTLKVCISYTASMLHDS